MMLISFIIPLYNCEGYISNCLDSILLCPLLKEEYEIIIINDGSTDLGPSECISYAEKYSNIELYSQNNKGASTARNVGLDVARGDFIWFVDGDDMIVPTILNRFIQYLTDTTLDLICFNYQKRYTECNVNIEVFREEKKINGVDFLKCQYPNYLWNKIFRTSSLCGKRFLDGTKNIEDMLFCLTTIVDMKNVLCIPMYGYQYNCTNSSSTSRSHSLRNLVKLDQDSITVLFALNDYIKSQEEENKQSVLLDNLNFSVIGHVYSLFRFYTPCRLKKRILEYKKVGLFPLGKCSNRKANLFRHFANNLPMCIFSMRIGKFVKSLRQS